jgi:hypothetical protein
LSNETTFAQGDTIPTQQMRLAYYLEDELRPTAKFAVIYHTEEDATAKTPDVRRMSLTPAQGRWLRDQLLKMYPQPDPVTSNS